MMPKGKNALIFLFFFFVNGGLMMAASSLTSPATGSFNEFLRPWVGKSTLPAAEDLKKVVIDAGHGGKDPGGMGDNSMEKDIALCIARLLAIGIRANYSDVEVIMTRSDDTFIPLYERAEIANKAGADLFISIHANIMPGSKATYGTETFVMGQHVANYNLDVAKRENAAILLESGDVTANYGYDPNSPEGHILMSMQQHAFLERSIQFAEAVERQFAGAGRKSRGVKQAGFVVLKATTMPAVLVETGFMSNLNEESFLLSKAGQQKLATALLMAFGEYYAEVTRGESPIVTTPVVSSPPPTVSRPVSYTPTVEKAPTPTPTQVSIFNKEIELNEQQPRQWTAKGVSPSPLTYQAPPASRPTPVPQSVRPVAPVTYQPNRNAAAPSVLRKEVTTQAAPPVQGNRVVPGVSPTPTPVTYSYPVSRPDSTSPTGYRFTEAKKRRQARPAGEVDLRTIPDQQLIYAIQVFATKRNLDLTAHPWDSIPYPITKVREGDLNKYQVRNLPNAASAKAAKERIKEAGIPESMIVVYLNGERLPAGAVKYLLER